MRSVGLLSIVVVLVACAHAAPPPAAPTPKDPAASTTVVAPPASAPEATSVRGLPRAAAPTPAGCTVEERRYGHLKIRFRPTDTEPLFDGSVDSHAVLLGVDGTLHLSGTLLAGTLHVFGFGARSEVELFTESEFGGMLTTRGAVKWVGTQEAGPTPVSLALHLPPGVTFDDAESVIAQVGCSAVTLRQPTSRLVGGTSIYLSGDLSRSPGGPPRLRGLRASGRRIGARGDWIHVVVDSGDLRAIGWARKRDVSEPAMGLGHGYGTGYGAAWAWMPPKGGIACPSPLAIYLPLPDGSFGEIGSYASGAPLWIKEADGAWTTVELGPSGIPEHAMSWRARTSDLAACTASPKAGPWKS